MTIMPGVPGKNHLRVIAAFEKLGYVVDRQTKHTIMKKEGAQPLQIPRHNPVNAFTMDGIIKKAGLTRAEFEDIY